MLLFLSLFSVDPPSLIVMGHCHTGRYNGHHKVLPGSSFLMPNHNFHMDFGWSHAMLDCHVEKFQEESKAGAGCTLQHIQLVQILSLGTPGPHVICREEILNLRIFCTSQLTSTDLRHWCQSRLELNEWQKMCLAKVKSFCYCPI